MIRPFMAVGAIAAAIAVSGCGSDSSGDVTAPAVSIPAVTSPLGTNTTSPATTITPPATTSTTRKQGNHYNPSLPDSATNDLPPPAGSPQDAFEKQCQQNPQACG